jgi:hypothetical protein
MFKEIPIDNTPVKDKKVTYEQILKLRILPTDDIPKPEAVLFFHEQMVMSRKNISCITGKAKVGKTFLMTLLNISVLKKGEFGTLRSYLPKGKDKIIYIDTEQSDYHILLILQRINKEVNSDKLLMFNFDAKSVEERKEFTRELIYNTPDCGLLVIDGIADLIYDPNDIRESSQMVSDLRKWATDCDLHIVNVIHQNPSENTKMRGHLGTILTNKAETVIQITSSKENESIKLVETLATRNRKPENWSFEIIEGQPTIMEECYEEPKTGRPKIVDLSDDKKYDILTNVFNENELKNGLGITVITNRYKELYGVIGVSMLQSHIRYFKELKWLIQDVPKGNYFLYPKNG